MSGAVHLFPAVDDGRLAAWRSFIGAAPLGPIQAALRTISDPPAGPLSGVSV